MTHILEKTTYNIWVELREIIRERCHLDELQTMMKKLLIGKATQTTAALLQKNCATTTKDNTTVSEIIQDGTRKEVHNIDKKKNSQATRKARKNYSAVYKPNP